MRVVPRESESTPVPEQKIRILFRGFFISSGNKRNKVQPVYGLLVCRQR